MLLSQLYNDPNSSQVVFTYSLSARLSFCVLEMWRVDMS